MSVVARLREWLRPNHLRCPLGSRVIENKETLVRGVQRVVDAECGKVRGGDGAHRERGIVKTDAACGLRIGLPAPVVRVGHIQKELCDGYDLA